MKKLSYYCIIVNSEANFVASECIKKLFTPRLQTKLYFLLNVTLKEYSENHVFDTCEFDIIQSKSTVSKYTKLFIRSFEEIEILEDKWTFLENESKKINNLIEELQSLALKDSNKNGSSSKEVKKRAIVVNRAVRSYGTYQKKHESYKDFEFFCNGFFCLVFKESPYGFRYFLWVESFLTSAKSEIQKEFDYQFELLFDEFGQEIEQLSKNLTHDFFKQKLFLCLKENLLVFFLKPEITFFKREIQKANSILNRKRKALKRLEKKLLQCKEIYDEINI